MGQITEERVELLKWLSETCENEENRALYKWKHARATLTLEEMERHLRDHLEQERPEVDSRVPREVLVFLASKGWLPVKA